MPNDVRAFLIQALLIQDWLNVPSVDGIGWTLEVQIKMYIVLFLMSRFKIFDKRKALTVIAILEVAFIVALQPFMPELMQSNITVYHVINTIFFSTQFIIL